MSDTSPFTIPEDITDYSHDEAYERGVNAGIDWIRNERDNAREEVGVAKSGERWARQEMYNFLTKSQKLEVDLTELGLAFRDYKIVHPEGTEDLHRKLAEQDATIKAVEEIAMQTVWASETVDKLRAILTRTKGTQ